MMIAAAHQAITREWWERRDRFDLYISRAVLTEAGGGEATAAARRLSVAADLVALPITTEAADLARRFLMEHAASEEQSHGS
jgi:hypothetical protein